MSLLDQNWGAGGSAEDEAHDENQQSRQVKEIEHHLRLMNNKRLLCFQ